MRYFSNYEHYIPGGPMFIYIGAEPVPDPSWVIAGHMHDMAKHHNGYCAYTEHRYYGKSRPTENRSVENLKYLSVDQAIADLINFIEYQRSQVPSMQKSKIILVGGSYGGSLVTWMKRVHPELITGGWASSAPLLAQLDFAGYKEIMTYAINQIGGFKCLLKLNSAFAEMEHLVSINQPKRIETEFKTCTEINIHNKLDVWNFFSSLTDQIAWIIQHNKPGSIDEFCRIMTDEKHEDGLVALAAYVRQGLEGKCYNFEYKDFIQHLKNVEWGGEQDIFRQWWWQTCTNFGYFQTSSSEKQIFGRSFPAELYIQMCVDAFGNKFTREVIEENIKKTNEKYGGLNPKVNNVYFSYGDLDPWRAAGLKKSYNSKVAVDIVRNISHVADMDSISDKDSKELKAVKTKIWNLVNKWLKE